MNMISAEPDLYDVDDDGVPTLFGLCDSTGFVSFPFQEYGSEYNGDHGDRVARIELCGTGVVSAITPIHSHLDPKVVTPYLLASIVLEEGPMVRSVLVDAPQAQIGTRVRAITVPVARGDGQVAELRFTPLIPKGDS